MMRFLKLGTSVLGGNALMFGLVAGFGVMAIMWDNSRISNVKSVERTKTLTKVRKANETATKIGRRSAAKSGRAAPVGVCPKGYRGC